MVVDAVEVVVALLVGDVYFVVEVGVVDTVEVVVPLVVEGVCIM